MLKVRFHLGAGENYKHWQIRNILTNSVEYHDPNKVQLFLSECTLKNEYKKAEKVFAEQKRDVCGWVYCENVEVSYDFVKPSGRRLFYDPKISPYWQYKDDPSNLDGMEFENLITFGHHIFTETKKLKEGHMINSLLSVVG
jgi:hypothetical protein